MFCRKSLDREIRQIRNCLDFSFRNFYLLLFPKLLVFYRFQERSAAFLFGFAIIAGAMFFLFSPRRSATFAIGMHTQRKAKNPDRKQYS